jgi:DNA-binding NarL/FixJ family response regulator
LSRELEFLSEKMYQEALSPQTMPRKAVSVAIVEDDAVIRRGWVDILQRLSGYRAAGEFGSGEEALENLPKDPPDFVLMDINLPGMSGIECTRELKRLLPDVEVLMLTMFGDRDRIFEALRAGAGGYLLKRTSPSALKAALEEACAGGAPMSPYVARQVVQYFRPSAIDTAARGQERHDGVEKLSPKENDILKLLAGGCQYKEIADRLEISMDTVRTHIRRIYQKLHVHSRTDAVVKYLAGEKAAG